MAVHDNDSDGPSSSTVVEVDSNAVTVPVDAGARIRVLSAELDHNLWPHLPEVLVHTVLRFLSAESIFKFRSVCKKWNEILTNPSFLEALLGAPHSSPFCVLADVINKRLAVYNIASSNWYYPPYENLFTGPFSTERTILTAAAAGLVLLEVLPESRQLGDIVEGFEFGRGKSLLLVNPVNKSYRKLPALEDGNPDDGDDVRCPKVVGIDVNSQSGSFQILARSTLFHIGGPRGARPGRSQFHVYDLETNTWEMIYDSRFSAGPEEWDNSYRLLEPAVLSEGFWYYLTYSHRFWGPRIRDATPHVFRVKRGIAEAVQAPLPHEVGMIIDFLHVFVCQGKVILAGSLKTIDNLIVNEWKSFRFWRLNEQRSEWVDYLKMPHYLVNYLGDRSVKRFALDLECSVDGDYICFWVGRPAGKQFRTIEIIMYSISRDSWWTVNSEVDLPRTHFESRGNWGCSCARGLYNRPFAYFMFKPNLNITL